MSNEETRARMRALLDQQHHNRRQDEREQAHRTAAVTGRRWIGDRRSRKYKRIAHRRAA